MRDKDDHRKPSIMPIRESGLCKNCFSPALEFGELYFRHKGDVIDDEEVDNMVIRDWQCVRCGAEGEENFALVLTSVSLLAINGEPVDDGEVKR